MFPRAIRTSLLPLLSLTAAVAGGAKPVQTYVAPTDRSILAATEMSHSGEGQVIVVTNHSTVPIIVTGVSLQSCENIKNRCGEATRMKARIGPRQRRTVLTVRADDPSRGHGFRFSFTWTAEAAESPLAGVAP